MQKAALGQQETSFPCTINDAVTGSGIPYAVAHKYTERRILRGSHPDSPITTASWLYGRRDENVRCPHAVPLLMAHLRITRPEFRFHQCATGHCPEAMPADVSFGIVAHQTQRPVDGVFTHRFVGVVIAEKPSSRWLDISCICFRMATAC